MKQEAYEKNTKQPLGKYLTISKISLVSGEKYLLCVFVKYLKANFAPLNKKYRN